MTSSSTLLSELPYLSLLAYATKDKSERGVLHSNAVKAIKNGRVRFVEKAVTRLFDENTPGAIRDLFRGNVVLVPTPRRRPLKDEAFWPAEFLCRKIVGATGQGRVLPLVARKIPVQKSSLAAPGERPLANEHFASMEFRPLAIAENRIVVVDDVVTRGATLLATCSHVKQAYPHCDVIAFAMIRAITSDHLPGNGEMFQPVEEGRIYLRGNETVREP